LESSAKPLNTFRLANGFLPAGDEKIERSNGDETIPEGLQPRGVCFAADVLREQIVIEMLATRAGDTASLGIHPHDVIDDEAHVGCPTQRQQIHAYFV
jgi:hypothetical protein